MAELTDDSPPHMGCAICNWEWEISKGSRIPSRCPACKAREIYRHVGSTIESYAWEPILKGLDGDRDYAICKSCSYWWNPRPYYAGAATSKLHRCPRCRSDDTKFERVVIVTIKTDGTPLKLAGKYDTIFTPSQLVTLILGCLFFGGFGYWCLLKWGLVSLD